MTDSKHSDRVRLKLKGVSSIVGFEDGALLILVNEDETRQMSVTCEKEWRQNCCVG